MVSYFLCAEYTCVLWSATTGLIANACFRFVSNLIVSSELNIMSKNISFSAALHNQNQAMKFFSKALFSHFTHNGPHGKF